MTSPACSSVENRPPTMEGRQAADEATTPPQQIAVPDAHEQVTLVGTWTEVAQISCQSSSERAVPTPIEELVFFEDQRISVTWFPFEEYVDYMGTYTLDDMGGLEIFPDEVNYLPVQLDSVGHYQIDDAGRLILTSLWLGVPPLDSAHPINCGHIFEKR